MCTEWTIYSGEGCYPGLYGVTSVNLFFFFKYFFWPFSGFIDSADEECDRKEGKRQGVTRSKRTRAGSRTRVRCRASRKTF